MYHLAGIDPINWWAWWFWHLNSDILCKYFQGLRCNILNIFKRLFFKALSNGGGVAGLLPKWLQLPGVGQAKARCQELDPGSPFGWQGPKDLKHLALLSRKLAQVQQPDLNQDSSIRSNDFSCNATVLAAKFRFVITVLCPIFTARKYASYGLQA